MIEHHHQLIWLRMGYCLYIGYHSLLPFFFRIVHPHKLWIRCNCGCNAWSKMVRVIHKQKKHPWNCDQTKHLFQLLRLHKCYHIQKMQVKIPHSWQFNCAFTHLYFQFPFSSQLSIKFGSFQDLDMYTSFLNLISFRDFNFMSDEVTSTSTSDSIVVGTLALATPLLLTPYCS